MEKTAIIGGHGLGDCCLALQCAAKAKQAQPDQQIDVLFSARAEICEPITYFAKMLTTDILNSVLTVPEEWSSNHNILEKEVPDFRNLFNQYNNVFYTIPDLLFRNKYAFDCIKYNTNPQIIKQTRVFEHLKRPQKRIYCGLQTTTKGYYYKYPEQLLKKLAELLPDYEIYFPQPTTWDGKKCHEVNGLFPDNVKIHKNCSLIDSLNILSESSYFVGTCNGPSHIAYQLGIPRLILDPQFGKIPWVARWKEDTNECAAIYWHADAVAKCIKTNLEIPQTLLIPREQVMARPNVDWNYELIFKY